MRRKTITVVLGQVGAQRFSFSDEVWKLKGFDKATRGLRGKVTPLSEEVKQRVANYKDRLQAIAEGAAEKMRNYIGTHSKHDSGKLASLLTVKVVERKDGEVSFYIGDKTALNKEAPYWYVLNFGKTISGQKFIPPPTVGYFGEGNPPMRGKNGKEKFTYSPTGTNEHSYYVEPKKFTPVNYITQGLNYISKEMKKLRNRKR